MFKLSFLFILIAIEYARLVPRGKAGPSRTLIFKEEAVYSDT
jgi:hypothetical protein